MYVFGLPRVFMWWHSRALSPPQLAPQLKVHTALPLQAQTQAQAQASMHMHTQTHSHMRIIVREHVVACKSTTIKGA